MKNLGTNIKFYRDRSSLTQLQLAKKVKVTSNYIALIETGKKIPSLRTLYSIAETLNVDAKNLINEDPLFEDLSKLANKYGLDQLLEQINKMHLS